MLIQRQGEEPKKSIGDRDDGSSALKASAQSAAPVAANAPPRKLSFKEKHALENLPQTIAKLEADIAKLSKRLDDPALYTRDRAAFDKATADLAKAQAALEAAELQWLELEELRVAFEGV
jgi:ATP-binding cassette subfamily F protein uup